MLGDKLVNNLYTWKYVGENKGEICIYKIIKSNIFKI